MKSRDRDLTAELVDRIRRAREAGTPFYVAGGDTKPFLGRPVQGESLSLRGHCGILRYEPTELVLTARSGTPLSEIHDLLDEQGQWLPFEPPSLGSLATLGGTIACGLSGPARPFLGAARDFVLGIRLLDGNGQILHFGGEVIKNVAGYDVSRFLVGAQGTLGVFLEVSLKVGPLPPASDTLVHEEAPDASIRRLCRLAAEPLPFTGACHDGERLFLRLSGSRSGVEAAAERIGGERLTEPDRFWQSVRERSHPFFRRPGPLWRLSLPPATLPPAPGEGELFIDWGGAQRWWRGTAEPSVVWEWAKAVGGHATLLDSCRAQLQPLAAGLLSLHKRLKAAFDPKGILNPGRLYEGL